MGRFSEMFKNRGDSKAPLGSGGRFAAIVSRIKSRNSRLKGGKKGPRGGKKITDPAAVAAVIGRRKYGKKRFQQLSMRGRAKKR